MFGIPPQLTRPIQNLANLGLTRSETRTLEKLVKRIERHFPQVELALVFAHSPDPAPLAAYTFWLFNRSFLFSAIDSGGENFGVLLVIDPTASRAAAMTGYGLEPILPDESLLACTDAMRAGLADEDFVTAAANFLKTLEKILTDAHRQTQKALGLSEDELWVKSLHQLANRTSLTEY